MVMPADFAHKPDMVFPRGSMEEEIRDAVGAGDAEFLDATRLATALMGDSIATNLFMVGYAYQRGLIPLHQASIMRAIELNGTAVESNKRAFHWGRYAALEPAKVEASAFPREARPATQVLSQSLDEMIARRTAFLTDYQDAAYANAYADRVARVREVEAVRLPGSTRLTEAVARYDFKLRAIKDEYEVARLYAQTDFLKRVDAQFEGDYKLVYHLAPPLTNKPDPHTGRVKKSTYGPWMMNAFRVLARFKGLRGTAFDIFGRTAERRMERKLLADYEALVDEMLGKLSPANLALAVEIASLPEHIRGYGHVKDEFVRGVKAKEAELVARWRAPAAPALPLSTEKVAA
jgi:indolepyruvate ferredoxin oxidoreductase